MNKNYKITKIFIKTQFGGKGNKILWKTFEHNGVMFPPEYIPIKVPIIYNGTEILLNPEAEEAATFYARYIDTEYVKNTRFNKNFWSDFKKLINSNLNINNFENIDFTLIKKYLEKKKEEKNSISKEEKERKKELDKQKEEKYNFAIIDGKKQKVGNFRIEPPGIFLGRGCHPKLGKIKKRILPKDITINISRNAKIPDTGIPNTKWGKVIHNNKSIWLANWKENIGGKNKYVWLSDQSDFKAKSDENKFNLAKILKRKIKDIRNKNFKNLNSNNTSQKQLATVLYFIDKLALRVGNEKSKNEADTVGVSSLRIEHIQLLGNNRIKLDFLGKDSIRYIKKFEVDPLVYTNIQKFVENKNSKDQLFDLINPADINKYLQSFMKNLTSKVFRTMNASRLFQKELNKISLKFNSYDKEDKINLILDGFNKANAKVALLCNHQKSVSKNFKEQINKIKTRINDLRKKRKELEDKKNEYKQKNTKRETIRNVNKRIKKIDLKINGYKSKKNLKIELKNVSLGTSKVNYIDPRITVSFMKKHNIDINKLFTKTLQSKFTWAMNVDENYKF